MSVRDQLNEMFGKSAVDYAVNAAKQPLGKPPCICRQHPQAGKTMDNGAWKFEQQCPIHGFECGD